MAAPQIAVKYWNRPATARLRDVVLVVRADEAHHRDTNHHFADQIAKARIRERRASIGNLRPELSRFPPAPPDRRALPRFYLFVLLSAATAAVHIWSYDPFAAGLLELIVVTTLHGCSVAMTFVHIGMPGLVMTRFIAMDLT